MADIIEYPVWEETVREVGEGEPVTGGPNGTVNYSLQDLANRTLWLKERVNLVITGRTVNGSILDFKNTTEIETEKWGKARDFIIADASQKHSSVTVSVNGSNAVTLVLPNTISANIIGNVTGDVTGNLTGNVTGNVRGNLDGDASGNAGSADKLSGQPAINGTTFDGTRDIDTERWGKARKITVQDADGSNKATAVSTDGGKDITLKLPATIKVTVKGNADSATKLGASDVGSAVKPIWLKAGAPTASNGNIGGTAKPIYMSAGELKAISASVGGTAKPVYMSAGEIKAMSATVGSVTNPVYMNAGQVKACTYELKKSVPADADFENTHFTTHLYVGASKANAHSAQTNGNVYLNLFDDTTFRHNILVVGNGSATVVSDKNGKITIDHLTSDGHKHIPSGGSSGKILKWSASGTAAWDNVVNVGGFPKPITGTGVGQIYTNYGRYATLPAGGTWFWWACCFNPNSTSIGPKWGIASGSANIDLQYDNTRAHLFAIRIG